MRIQLLTINFSAKKVRGKLLLSWLPTIGFWVRRALTKRSHIIPHNTFGSFLYRLGFCFGYLPATGSGWEGAPGELSKAMVHRTPSCCRGEVAFEEVSETMARRIRRSAFVASPQALSGREGQRSSLKPWRVAFWSPLLLPPHKLFLGARVRQRSSLKPRRAKFWASH